MKKKIELGTVIFIVTATVVLTFLATLMFCKSKQSSLTATENSYPRLRQVEKTINTRYIGEVDENKSMDALLTGYVSGIDKYSTYLNAESLALYTAQQNGKYSGVGVTVKYVAKSGLLKVIGVKSNSPADLSGIKKSDFIVKINDKNVADMSYDESVAMLKAENGTTIDITVLRDDKEVLKNVTVAEYTTSSIEGRILADDVGYISISEFDNTTADDFIKRVESLKQEGAKQFVFDVRNNTGGSLTSVVKILDYLLPEGTLVTLKDKTGKEDVYTSDANKFDLKYTVLINESTYSGGELFAAAIRDFKAGTIIGQTTYGKGYAQEIIPLSEGALYLSTKLYYPPCGENFEGVGVSPDIDVKLSAELEDRFYELTTEEDTQLVEALKQLGKDIVQTENK